MKINFTLILTVFCMLCMGQNAYAAIASGACGEKLSWSLEKDSTLSISGTGAMTNWSTYADVPWYAYGSFIKKVSLGDAVTSIGENAFYDCSQLSSIAVPASITSIGNAAFYNCTGLKEVNVSSIEAWCGIAFGNICSNPCTYSHKICVEGSEVTELAINNTVTSISNYAFAGCSGLTSVILPNTIQNIGNYAFHDCMSLSSVVIPSSVTSIGDYAFFWCVSLSAVYIPNSITSIGEDAFSGCQSLTAITIPGSVTHIGSGAFSACPGLTLISVDASNPTYDSRDNCNAIIETQSSTLVLGCVNTVIPNTVSAIGEYAFSGCSELTSLTIPTSVERIDDYAFFECSQLTDASIPSTVKSIGSAVFFDCAKLTSASIPSKLEKIADYTFCGCSALKSVTIPNGITSIGDMAFFDCAGISALTSEGMTPPALEADMFEDSVYAKVLLYVPSKAIEAYKAADYWKNFATIKPILNADYFDNVVYVDNATAYPNVAMQMPVNMRNTESISAVQFDVYLPEGIAIAKDESGDFLVDINTERTSLKNHTIQTKVLPSGGIRVVVYSNGNSVFSGNSGAVVNLNLNISETITLGEYTVQLKNIVMSKPTGDILMIDSLASKITVDEFELGDLSGDGLVNVGDLTMLVGLIMEGYSTHDRLFQAADMNQDETLNASDITLLVSLIMEKSKAFVPYEDDEEESFEEDN